MAISVEFSRDANSAELNLGNYSLGYEGRVNLLPVANHAFYTSMGFEATYVTQDGDTLLEIPTKTARELLQSRGVIDG